MLFTSSYRAPVRIPVPGTLLEGDVTIPRRARALVVFAHGSGSSRVSPRNRRVARWLNSAGLATLLVDLLDSAEERQDAITGELRFNIPLLSTRVERIVTWCSSQGRLADLDIGLFGASTGAAAALVAASRLHGRVHAVVSRGGRPDLAGTALSHVAAPTLLIVGGADEEVVALNRSAQARMQCESDLVLVPGAGHLFSGAGELDEVSRLAAAWFRRHLATGIEQVVARDHGYEDRMHAADVLATIMSRRLDELSSPVVVGIPRGGIVVAAHLARRLSLPLGMAGVHKVGAPDQPELAIGAVDEDGEVVEDQLAARYERDTFLRLAQRQAEATRSQAASLRTGLAAPDVSGRDVVLVDDGCATGMTATAAARMLRRHGARHVLLAVPVAPAELVRTPPPGIDEVLCPYTPEPYLAVGAHYRDFPQVDDAHVRSLLVATNPPVTSIS